MKARFTEEQIIKILKEHEGGKLAADIVRENNITEHLKQDGSVLPIDGCI